jgi:hypothetical protein
VKKPRAVAHLLGSFNDVTGEHNASTGRTQALALTQQDAPTQRACSSARR